MKVLQGGGGGCGGWGQMGDPPGVMQGVSFRVKRLSQGPPPPPPRPDAGRSQGRVTISRGHNVDEDLN